MREEYFQSHHPNFNHENTCDFTEVFWCMIKTADLFGSAIFKITDAWSGQDELWQANYSLMTLQKGLKFFRAVSPSKSPKVMGLTGIQKCGHATPLQWGDPLPLLQKGGPKWGYHHQSPENSALQTGPHVQIMFLLPIRLLRGHLPQWSEELPTIRGGRPWWVLLIGVTTSPGCTRSTFP